MPGLRTGIPATWSMLTVFSLSVSRNVGAPPNRRKHASNAANTLGKVLSRIGMITRVRDHASQAHSRIVFTPATRGPSPKSYWAHMPGSVTHGGAPG